MVPSKLCKSFHLFHLQRWERIHKPLRKSGFLWIFKELYRFKVKLASRYRNFVNGIANFKIVYSYYIIRWYTGHFSNQLAKIFIVHNLRFDRNQIWKLPYFTSTFQKIMGHLPVLCYNTNSLYILMLNHISTELFERQTGSWERNRISRILLNYVWNFHERF